MNYKKYPKYKPSGIEWIDDASTSSARGIPEHWEVIKLRNLGIFSSSGIDKKINPGEPLVRIINYTDVYGNTSLILSSKREYMEVSCPSEKIKEHLVKKGDLIFTPSSETIEDIGLSALVDEDLENTAYSYHVLRFRFTRDVNHSFKKYLCNNLFVLNQFSSNAKGTTRQILNRDVFNTTIVILPPLSEQTAIANFLDDKTAKIDSLIEKKKKLIELYKEERTAVINHYVLGQHLLSIDNSQLTIDNYPLSINNYQLPKHWEVKKLKYVASVNPETLTEKEDQDMLINYIDISSVDSDGNIIDVSEYLFSEAPSRARRILKNGDTILSTVRTYLKAIAYIEKVFNNLICSTGFAVIRPSGIFNKKFLFYILRSNILIEEIMKLSKGVSYPAIDSEDLKSIYVWFTGIEEQQQIVEYIEAETKRIDEKIKRTEKEIELLQEYRTALISEVVTGKIKIIDN